MHVCSIPFRFLYNIPFIKYSWLVPKLYTPTTANVIWVKRFFSHTQSLFWIVDYKNFHFTLPKLHIYTTKSAYYGSRKSLQSSKVAAGKARIALWSMSTLHTSSSSCTPTFSSCPATYCICIRSRPRGSCAWKVSVQDIQMGLIK